MRLIIDGRVAVLKEGSTFDYVSENRAFSDADGYSFSITLPLAGCAVNREIFGWLDRKDADSREVMLDASILDRDLSLHGVVTVMEANRSEIKVQFLEGRSVQNFATTFDDIYINDMGLPVSPYGDWIGAVDPAEQLKPYGATRYRAGVPVSGYTGVVSLPWINDNTGTMLNEVVVTDGELKWSDGVKAVGYVSNQVYLIALTRWLFESAGYSCDLSAWEESDDRYLLCCNSLPGAWEIADIARALPRWSLTRYVEELEKLLVAEFDIDHKARSVSMRFCAGLAEPHGVVLIDRVVDSFSAEVGYDGQLTEYRGMSGVRYSSPGYDSWSRDNCGWLIDTLRKQERYFKEFDSYAAMIEWLRPFFPGSPHPSKALWLGDDDAVAYEPSKKLMYCRAEDAYYLYVIEKAFGDYRWMVLTQINRFADLPGEDGEDGDWVELDMVPVCVLETDDTHGRCMFLKPSEFNESSVTDADGVKQPYAYSALLMGQKEERPEYYSKIFVGYWDGSPLKSPAVRDLAPVTFVNPVVDGRPAPDSRYSLALRDRQRAYFSGIRINRRERVKFSWLADGIPDVRAVFHIAGKRYLCEKITATFSERGMSQLLKGEFFPVVD